ncbi:MAG: PP2C family protein-serine/threonine phosphatase [Hyphomicrobium sp.]
MRVFEYASLATLGKRARQEDSHLFWTGNTPVLPSAVERKSRELLAVLADGMGGHVGGAIASQIGCEAFTHAFSRGEGDIPFRMNFALNSANQKIAQTICQNPKLLGMGSTLLSVFFFNNCFHWISVGDSLLYLFRKGKITILNEDHSMAPLIDRRAAECIPHRRIKREEEHCNMLRSALMGGNISLVDLTYCPLQLQNADIVVLASDGILSLTLSEIEKILSHTQQKGPLSVAQSIVEGVEGLDDPNQDNITVMVVRYLFKN